MLRATAFPAPYNSVPVLSGMHTCCSLAATRVIYSRFSFVSRFESRQFRQPRRNGMRAVRGGGIAGKKQGQGGAGPVGMEGDFDNDGDVDYEYDDDEDYGEGDDDEEGEEMLPLEEMEKWFEKKPKGFGEGKVYDTSVEDKLLEEMQQSKESQAVNLEKLKANPVKPVSKKNAQEKKDAGVVPVGGRVRLVNLPKKKNIHRDLKLAFQGVPGIMNIVPAVTGNEKTRDPVCKGFAFVDFKREEDAVRFVELYTAQTITFGKIQKQINCELLNVQSSSSSSLKLTKNLNTAPNLMVSTFEEDSNEDSDMDDSALSCWDGTVLDDSDEQQESDRENQEFAIALKLDCDDSVETRIDSEINSLPSKQVNRNPTTKQKSSAKVRQENTPKKKLNSKMKVKKVLNVPGSAKRLKVKEKAVLSDVFSKYGSKATLASKDS